MKKYLLFTILLYLLFVLENYAQSTNYEYRPSEEELTVDHAYVESFIVFINPFSDFNGWSSKIEVTNAINVSPNPQTGTTGSWLVDFTMANTQATVKISCLKNGVLMHSKTWKISVRSASALSISGADEIKDGNTVTYTANVTNYTGPTLNYQWSSVNGNLNIVSGQGSQTVTVSPKIASGSDQLKVTVGGLSATKNIAITSTTTNITNQSITTNRNFSNRYINISNTNITNNAVVNITAEESVKITPNFLAQQGTKVIIRATGGILRSSNIIDKDESEYEVPSEEVFEEPENTTSIKNITEISQTVQVNIYSIAGLLVYSSITDFDIQSANLDQGIYIVETINDRGEIKREKVLINR